MDTAVLLLSVFLDAVNLCIISTEKSNRHVLVRILAPLTLLSLFVKGWIWARPDIQFCVFRISCGASLFFSAAVSSGIFLFLIGYKYAKSHRTLHSDKRLRLQEVDPAALGRIPKQQSMVIETENLYLIFPRYTEVRLTVGSEDTESAFDITFWGSGPYKSGMFRNNVHSVIGPFLINGTYYDSGLRAGEMLLGSFIRTENGFRFCSPQESESALRNASGKPGSYGFSSNLYILNGEPRPMECTYTTVNCFRALGEFGGRLCVIDSKKNTRFSDFFEELQKIGLTNAIAMDMGAYSNYSWYLDSKGQKVKCCHRVLNKSKVALIFIDNKKN